MKTKRRSGFCPIHNDWNSEDENIKGVECDKCKSVKEKGGVKGE